MFDPETTPEQCETCGATLAQNCLRPTVNGTCSALLSRITPTTQEGDNWRGDPLESTPPVPGNVRNRREDDSPSTRTCSCDNGLVHEVGAFGHRWNGCAKCGAGRRFNASIHSCLAPEPTITDGTEVLCLADTMTARAEGKDDSVLISTRAGTWRSIAAVLRALVMERENGRG
jgi:hypothetical protein